MARASDLVFGTVAVPADGPPPYYPEVVAGFEALGFRRVGGLLADLSDAEVEDLLGEYAPDVQPEMRLAARNSETVLAAPDASAFVGVDWFYGMPSVRTAIPAGRRSLVETQRAWDWMPSQPLALARYAAQRRLRPEQDGSAPGRLMTLVETDDPAQLWSAHQEAIARSEETPVVHRTIQQAQALWRQCLLHDARIAMRAGLLAKAALYGVQVIGLTIAALFVLLGWLWWGLAACVIGAAVALVLGLRGFWWLRYARWGRPRFQAP